MEARAYFCFYANKYIFVKIFMQIYLIMYNLNFDAYILCLKNFINILTIFNFHTLCIVSVL